MKQSINFSIDYNVKRCHDCPHLISITHKLMCGKIKTEKGLTINNDLIIDNECPYLKKQK